MYIEACLLELRRRFCPLPAPLLQSVTGRLDVISDTYPYPLVDKLESVESVPLKVEKARKSTYQITSMLFTKKNSLT